MRFNADTVSLETPETELSIHDGTIRDCVFMDDVISGISKGQEKIVEEVDLKSYKLSLLLKT